MSLWPFVSRARYELLEHNYEAVRTNSQNFQEFLTRELNAHTDRLLADERARYDDLLNKYHDLVKPPVVIKHENGKGDTRPRSAVAEAIRQEAGSDIRLAGYLRKRASELKAEGLSDADIAVKLREWETTEPARHTAEVADLGEGAE